MTKQLHFDFSLSCIGEGNGNPLKCSCLENPRDCGAWWAAICGVTQSPIRLKRLGSGSSNLKSMVLNPQAHNAPLLLPVFWFNGLRYESWLLMVIGPPGWHVAYADGKESACNAGDLGSIPGSGRSSGERKGNPLQYSCLENPMDRGA